MRQDEDVKLWNVLRLHASFRVSLRPRERDGRSSLAEHRIEEQTYASGTAFFNG